MQELSLGKPRRQLSAVGGAAELTCSVLELCDLEATAPASPATTAEIRAHACSAARGGELSRLLRAERVLLTRQKPRPRRLRRRHRRERGRLRSPAAPLSWCRRAPWTAATRLRLQRLRSCPRADR